MSVGGIPAPGPFRGLVPYDENSAALFFGRADEIVALDRLVCREIGWSRLPASWAWARLRCCGPGCYPRWPGTTSPRSTSAPTTTSSRKCGRPPDACAASLPRLATARPIIWSNSRAVQTPGLCSSSTTWRPFSPTFHSVGGYGTIATGKLLTDILAGVLGLHSKSAPKYGSEKSGAPTNYYITLSPEPIKITNAELEDVEIVVSPDHKVFSHTNPLRGLAPGGTFIMQSTLSPLDVWKELPASVCAMGILVALLEREVSGQGQWVQSNLLAAQIAMLDFQAARWTIGHEVPDQAGNDHPTSMPTGVYVTADGHFNIGAAGDAIYGRFCKVVGAAQLATDPRFVTNADRSNNRRDLNEAINAITRTKTSAEWIAILNGAGVPCGPIYSIDQVFADPQVRHLNLTRHVPHKVLGDVEVIGQAVELAARRGVCIARRRSRASIATRYCGNLGMVRRR